ncbi:MAG: hypothetical protein ACTHK5_12970 [Tsuneonella sp.]
MGSKKRPKLATHYSGPRAGSRDAVSIDGRCRVGDGDEEAIAVLDLDPRGCRVRGITVAVSKADAIAVWIGPVGPLGARLRWVKRGEAGLKLDEPLSDEDLERATSHGRAPPSEGANVIALRRRVAG